MVIHETDLQTCDDFIGKYYTLLNIDGSVLTKIKINYCRVTMKPFICEETGCQKERKIFTVSENKAGWYTYYANASDRIEIK